MALAAFSAVRGPRDAAVCLSVCFFPAAAVVPVPTVAVVTGAAVAAPFLSPETPGGGAGSAAAFLASVGRRPETGGGGIRIGYSARGGLNAEGRVVKNVVVVVVVIVVVVAVVVVLRFLFFPVILLLPRHLTMVQNNLMLRHLIIHFPTSSGVSE